MSVEWRCECGRALRAPESAGGKRARCPDCGGVSVVPGVVPLAPVAAIPVVDGGGAFYGGHGQTSLPMPPVPEVSRERGWRDYLYLVLLAALFPLAMSTFSREAGSIKDRIYREAEERHPDLQSRVRQMVEGGEADLDDILEVFPGRRLAGAFLPRDSGVHWLMAVVATGVFFMLLLLMLQPGHARVHHLLLSALFTATVGIVLLLIFQVVADVALAGSVVPTGKGWLLWLLLKFIGFSYYAAERPDYGFFLSFLGFTCGVGLCEELCKAIPLLWLMRKKSGRVSWRGACAWGLASGIGFGVAEGVMYSSRYYNGVLGGDIYLVRFASCVALHAIWSASVAVALFHKREQIMRAGGVGGMLGYGLVYAFVPMVLHGLYDTMLKKEYNVSALGVALASFVYLAAMVEWSRQKEIARFEATRQGETGVGAGWAVA